MIRGVGSALIGAAMVVVGLVVLFVLNYFA
jgi:hypothetical protein